MNVILQNKLKELENAKDYECWYLVKQPTAFDSLCYLVSFLEKFKSKEVSNNLQDFIGTKINELKASKPNVEISNNYRALRVAAYFGLITMTSSKYDEAIITETFREITSKCGGDYEKSELYLDIIQRQIEKMFISSQIDEASNKVRKEYRLYPVMLLYKILIEMGRSTGIYQISMTEYRYLVATSKMFEDFLNTLLLIKLLREDESAVNDFEKYRMKFDNRLIQALKQLPTLSVDKNFISIKEEYRKEVAEKVFIFEENPTIFTTDNYLEFLASTRSLFEIVDFKKNVKSKVQEDLRIDNGVNVLLYGVPGAGKSWTIEHEYCTKKSIAERLVFHPDYTYSDFIGQILPDVDKNGKVTYKFTPGPFTSILKEAYNHPKHEYILIIEEINRGNAPAIFGEVFQLLDRKKEIRDELDDGYPIGTSEYGITNANIAEIVYKDAKQKVRIPSNLSIIGTMNTSDQNVFTLDTAFQRRWEMHLIENNFDNVDPKLANAVILDTTVTWRSFCTAINNLIFENNARMISSEDKSLGAYFLHINDLKFNNDMGDLSSGEYETLLKKEGRKILEHAEEVRLAVIRNAMKQNRRFPEKVLKYLWDDAFKFNRDIVFETSEYQSLEQIIHSFLYAKANDRFNMFKDNVRAAFTRNEK